MTVTLNLSDEALKRLEAEALRRGVAVETVINELAAALPQEDDRTVRGAAGLIGLGASSSGRFARDADAMLDGGFGHA